MKRYDQLRLCYLIGREGVDYFGWQAVLKIAKVNRDVFRVERNKLGRRSKDAIQGAVLLAIKHGFDLDRTSKWWTLTVGRGLKFTPVDLLRRPSLNAITKRRSMRRAKLPPPK